MKKVIGVYRNQDMHWVGDGFPVKNLFSYDRLGQAISPFLLLDYAAPYRFDAIVDLKLPLNYIVLEGYGLDEVHILNQNAKVWNADDYMNGYCELGYLDYLRYREFKTKYALGHNETATLLSGSTSKQLVDIFYTGCFKIKDYDKAVTIIEKILMLEPYYSGVRRRAFIYAMVSLLSNPAFEFTEFLQKLKLQPTVMQDCTTSQNYKILIEEVYNYRRHQKVNLRF